MLRRYTPLKRKTPLPRGKAPARGKPLRRSTKPIRSRKAPAKVADKARFKLMRGLLCVACAQLQGVPPAYPEGCDVSHLKSGDRRIGHDHSLLECPWHHRGVPPWGHTQQSARKAWGPSRAKSPRAYAERFGTDERLLELTNQALERRRQNTVGGSA